MKGPKEIGKGSFKELLEDGITYCTGVKMTRFSPDEIEVHEHPELFRPVYMSNPIGEHLEYGFIIRILGSYGIEGEFISTEEYGIKSLDSVIEDAHDFVVDGIKSSPTLNSWIIRIKVKPQEWKKVK